MKRLIAEWEKQSFIQLILPPQKSDWNIYYDEILAYYETLIKLISKYTDVHLICEDEKLLERLGKNIRPFIKKISICKTNDTWARDISAISIEENGTIKLLNFSFNAWGDKYPFLLDNAMNENLANVYLNPMKNLNFILEGGAIDTNGQGIILTTKNAVLNPNRYQNKHSNKYPKKEDISKNDYENLFIKELGAKKVLWLENGFLEGDDTDSHIDNLARFIDKNTIVYLKSYDKNDTNFIALEKMESELKKFRNLINEPFSLLPLPQASPKYFNGKKLPCSYLNFLFVNNALIIPIYDKKYDRIVLKLLQDKLKNIQIIGINSLVPLRQGGSLHCLSMHFPKGVELK